MPNLGFQELQIQALRQAKGRALDKDEGTPLSEMTFN
jgi:hypothetical protein